LFKENRQNPIQIILLGREVSLIEEARERGLPVPTSERRPY